MLYWKCTLCDARGASANAGATLVELEIEHSLSKHRCNGTLVETSPPPPPKRALALCQQCGRALWGQPTYEEAAKRTYFTFVCTCELTRGRTASGFVADERFKFTRDGIVVFSNAFGGDACYALTEKESAAQKQYAPLEDAIYNRKGKYV